MNKDIDFSNGPIVIMEGYDSEPYHMHKNAQELIWVLEGEAGVTFNNKEHILNTEDDLILIVDADFHEVRKVSDQLRYLSFYIDLPFFERYIKDILHVGLYVNPGYRTPEQIPHLKKMRILLAQIVREYQDDKCSQLVVDITNQLLLLIRNHFNFLGTTSIDYKDQHIFDRLFGVYDFAYQHYTERVTLADLANHIHVSQTYLSRSIKQLTGMSFTEILNYVRCEEALRLLLETEKSITTIAYDSGFSDPKYFHQYFNKFFHANPVEFRKNHKARVGKDSWTDRQSEIAFDDKLKEKLHQFWQQGDLSERKATHLLFETDDSGFYEGDVDGGLTVLVTEKDFAEHGELPQLLQELDRDFEKYALTVSREEAGKDGLHDVKLWPVELMRALKEKNVSLFSSTGGFNGLYTANSVKTPLYYMLEAAASAEGEWEYGNNWAVCREGQEKKKLLLLAWNGSLEQSIEFQIDFRETEQDYLVLEYEFSNSILEVFSQLSEKSMTDMFNPRQLNALTHICHPSCRAKVMNLGDKGFLCKVGPGRASILSIIKK